MKRSILIILLISLLFLFLAGAALLHPYTRFVVKLHNERFEEAAAVYYARLCTSVRLDQAARKALARYVEQQLDGYYQQQISFDQVMGVLTPLSRTGLPYEDMDRCIQAVGEMEAARTHFVQAESYYASAAYAQAIPLYRQSLIADDSVQFLLNQAETAYKNQILDAIEKDLVEEQYDSAENTLLDGLSLLGSDDDLSAALTDVRRLRDDKAYGELLAKARELLRSDGARTTFQWIDDLRRQSPDEYSLTYMEQLIRHEYEEDICARAVSLQERGDPEAACALLKEGSLLLDSPRIRALHAQIKAAIPVLLTDMPLLLDKTKSPRTGAESTVACDVILTDIRGNEYAHSFSVDIGSVTFALQGEYDLFSGIVAFPAGERSDIYRESATLEIMADGKPLSEFKNIDSSSSPFPFSLPVDGVDELTLIWTCSGANGWKDWGRFATLFDGMFQSVPPQE